MLFETTHKKLVENRVRNRALKLEGTGRVDLPEIKRTKHYRSNNYHQITHKRKLLPARTRHLGNYSKWNFIIYL